MDARYKIVFRGEFKEWVVREEFIQAIRQHLKVSEEKAAALFEVDRKITLKKNLSETEAKRHAAAFEKMGMMVTKRLMMKPFVGPCIERESRAKGDDVADIALVKDDDKCDGIEYQSSVIQHGKKRLSSLTSGLKSLVNKEG